MFAAAYGTISDIEVVWLLIALFGAAYSSRNAKEANKDLVALKLAGVSNGRQRIAKTARFQDTSRVVVHAIFGAIGGLAMFLPDSGDIANQPWYVSAIGFLVRWGLITGSAILVVQSYMAHRLRSDLLIDEQNRVLSEGEGSLFRLVELAEEADDRRLAGPKPEQDVVREEGLTDGSAF